MADFRCDQAAGLRRLIAPRVLRVVTFASGTAGAGKTTIVANVAVALARQGQEVLIVDENDPAHQGAFFGLRATGDLLQVINRQRDLEAVMFSPMPGLSILPAGQAARQLGRLSTRQRQAMQEGLHALAPDVILIDADPEYGQRVSPWELASSEVVMVVSASGAAITEAYARIKKISLAFSRRCFRILVNRARQPEEGRRIFDNLQKVAAQRGIARLEYGGALPLDTRVKQVGQLFLPIVETLPEASFSDALKTFASHLLHWPAPDCENVRGVEQFIEQLLHFCHPITSDALST
ncbi:MAG: AAA family ATPase [Zoogloeaceae bacterium]|jgi:flagellar biosynthesis protein FlhG|nr:AAA family ATPase [Zoogloeaceae bacterium]